MTAGTPTSGASPTTPVGGEWDAAWTRGAGCEDLAGILTDGDATRIEGDLRQACVAARASILVTAKLTSFDLLRTVVPHNLVLQGIGSVVAAVGSGPHSILAARVAARLADRLQVEGSLVSVSQDQNQDDEAAQASGRISAEVPGIPHTLVREPSARALVDDLPDDAALVIGAPGGSWLQRQFFGPGRQLVVRAKAGAIVVRDSPRRCFHQAEEPFALGIGLRVADALLLAVHKVMAVVEDGILVGIIRRSALEAAPPDATVESIMEDAVFLSTDDPVDAAADLAAFLNGSPIPVVDASGRLFGSLAPPA